MAIPQAREGESVGFHAYPTTSDEGTLGEPEKIIWSSIQQLCSKEVAEGIAGTIHRVNRRNDRIAIAKNLKVYIRQAFAFYEAAQNAKANTAPLLYYYSFLNLAKARCEFSFPRLHKKSEAYRHGISWSPNREYLLNVESDKISLTTRGVWHLLHESLVGAPCRIANPTRLRICDLFSYCPEMEIEYERTIGKEPKFVYLEEPDVLYDSEKAEAWIHFSINRGNLRQHKLSRPKFLAIIESNRSGYRQVSSGDPDLWAFDSSVPKQIGQDEYVREALRNDIKAFNLFCSLYRGHVEYAVPVQTFPIRLPQIMVLYSILFWLGSLVRYDPHSVDDLMDSKFWILVDGFMNQSRIWLLELFEWDFFDTETTLQVAR